MNPLTPWTAAGEPSVFTILWPDPLVRTTRLSD